MSKSTESSAQRRKLVDEIRHLADIAVFGTLSETYRTWGRAGCHCQSGGPKHGPHLNIHYRGEKGKTTGYYVPQGAATATRQVFMRCINAIFVCWSCVGLSIL